MHRERSRTSAPSKKLRTSHWIRSSELRCWEDSRNSTCRDYAGSQRPTRATALLAAVVILILCATAGAASRPCWEACGWQSAKFREVVSRDIADLSHLPAVLPATGLRAPAPAGESSSADTPSLPESTASVESQTTWNPPRPHYFLRVGGDGAMGLYLETGPGLSGYWGVQSLLAEAFFTLNAEFASNKVFPGLLDDLLGEEISIFPTGQAVGAGARLRLFTDATSGRGAHGFGVGIGAVALVTDSDLGTSATILGRLDVSASWPFVELNVYYQIPVESTNSELLTALKRGTIGVSLGIRDPLSPLMELLRRTQE